MELTSKIPALEEVFERLALVNFDQLNYHRFQKERKDLNTILGAVEIGVVQDAILREMICVPVQLSVLAIEHYGAKDEILFNFVARYFRNPCQMRLGRVEEMLADGIQLFSSNSLIPMELGRTYYGMAANAVRQGKPHKVAVYLEKVQEYFGIAAHRISGIEHTTADQILEMAYTCLPTNRGNKR